MFANRSRLARIISHPVVALILLSLVWSCISLFTAANPLLSLKFILAKTWYIIPFVFGTIVFIDTREKLLTAVSCFVVPMVVMTAVALIRHALTGFSFERVSDVVSPFFRNHVNYGAILVCTIPPVYVMLKRKGRNYTAWFISLVILLTGCYFSYSRGAWLALPVGLMMALIVRKGRTQWALAISMIVVMAAASWLVSDNRYLQYRTDYVNTIYHAELGDHIEATYSLKDLSTAERFYRWVAGWRMATDHLLMGVGPNHFYPAYRSYTVEAFRTYVSDNPERSTVHNYFLLLLSEQGIPGLLLFLLTLFAMFLSAQRIYRRSSDPAEKIIALVIACILGMITVLICLSDLVESDKLGSIFYICAGLLVATGSGSYVERIAKPVPKDIER
jgi:O-antigen ligase